MHIDLQNQRRVLMIAHAFPPTGGSGVQRPAKFAKYLPQFGWTPHVWTADHIPGLPIDLTLCDDLPSEVAIHRFANRDRLRAIAVPPVGEQTSPAGTHDNSPPIHWRENDRGEQASPEWTAELSPELDARTLRARFLESLRWRIQRVIARRFPDDAITWAGASVKPLLKLIKKEKIEVILSTFSPASCHWLALKLKRRTGLPWVADFRDLWTDDCRYRETPRRRAAHRKLEDAILCEADIVVGVTPSQTELLARRVPGRESKFITITNGFDPADFASIRVPQPLGWGTDESLVREPLLAPLPVRTKRNPFVLSHVGRLDAHRVGEEFFAAIRVFAAQLASHERFILRIIGHCNEHTRQRLGETGIRCEFADYVDHAEAIREMCAADALLLLLPKGANSETIIAGKVFEYLAAQRPILAIGPLGSETLRIVSDYCAGIATPFRESEIVRALETLLNKTWVGWNTAGNAHPASIAGLQSFNRIELTRQLAEVFNQLTATVQLIRARSVSDESTIRTPSASDAPESSVEPGLPAFI